ncbi:SufB/SufD family protein [Spiroplasma apis]|uniref:FeS assembly protein SufD n=1 Tax=Spiroplasma apis B31 TaxID=1276258 RepID=V5RJI5_SPIAP|nr:SufD family Fe-S cluster assembly protein [Spiroplasma apis]AHB36628.1 FeS assembly protein SufD [Spiroplasma apis B31]
MWKNPNFIDYRNNLASELVLKTDENKVILLGESDGKLNIVIKANTSVSLTILFLPIENSENDKNFNINITIEDSSRLDLKIANLMNCNANDNLEINLKETSSSIEFYSATIVNKNFIKNSVIKSLHNARNTSSNIKAYEVLKNESKGFIRCISDIKKGSSSSEAHQELRLLVLDKKAKADSDPVLLIDENDIVASHANAIGMLDPDQIFYLLSRGLNKEEAQELIINGYFEPVFLSLNDDEIVIYLKDILKGMI